MCSVNTGKLLFLIMYNSVAQTAALLKGVFAAVHADNI